MTGKYRADTLSGFLSELSATGGGGHTLSLRECPSAVRPPG